MTAVEWFNQEIKELFNQHQDGEISGSIFHFQRLVALTTAKEMQRNDIENNAIHFAEWLTKKHTTTLMILYEQFKQEEQ